MPEIRDHLRAEKAAALRKTKHEKEAQGTGCEEKNLKKAGARKKIQVRNASVHTRRCFFRRVQAGIPRAIPVVLQVASPALIFCIDTELTLFFESIEDFSPAQGMILVLALWIKKNTFLGYDFPSQYKLAYQSTKARMGVMRGRV